MAETAREELHASLRKLYLSAKYSDVTIASRSKKYPAHRIVVCPRSEYLARACDNLSSPENGELNLRDDDPQAVDMIMQYLYHLNYPAVPSEEPARLNGIGHNDVPSDEERGRTAGGLDGQPRDEAVVTPEAQQEFDIEFPHAAAASKKAKKRKKKPRAPTVGGADAEEMRSEVGGEPPAESLDEVVAGAAPAGQEEPEACGSLAVHAKVYELSKKYRIEGLKLLALQKFAGECGDKWDTPEFLEAAKAVYSSPPSADDDRSMKDMITEAVIRHEQVLDQPEVQKVVRALPELSYELLFRVRKQRGSPSH